MNTTVIAPYREVVQKLKARPASDGAGVRLDRVFGGGRTSKDFDPFLLLDEFGSDEPQNYIAGFPPHPHRGFETVTYMLAGKMKHEDSLGNTGVLNGGDVQWMTAARGIIHSEMPQQEEGLMRGFQLWVNLPASEKMKDPHYQDISAKDIPQVVIDGINIKVIAGDLTINQSQLNGAVKGISTAPVYLDVEMPAHSQIDIPLPDGHTVLLYVYENNIKATDSQVPISKSEIALLSKKGRVHISSDKASRFLLLAGSPIGEPIAQYGPFVMNTPKEIEQAIQDYRDGVLAS